MIDVLDRLDDWLRSLRAVTAPAAALRGATVLFGLCGLLVATRTWSGAAIALVVLGALGVAGALGWPDGPAPTVAMAAMGGAWLLSYGWTGTPAPARTAALAGLGYLFHTTVTLIAAVPASSRPDRRLLTRWAGHVAVSLVGAAALAAIAFALGRRGGSLTLELLGLFGVVLVVLAPVWLIRGRA